MTDSRSKASAAQPVSSSHLLVSCCNSAELPQPPAVELKTESSDTNLSAKKDHVEVQIQPTAGRVPSARLHANEALARRRRLIQQARIASILCVWLSLAVGAMSVFLGCSCAPPSLSLIALGAGMLIDAVSSLAVLWRFEKDPATAPLSRQFSLRVKRALVEKRTVVASADEEDSASTAAASISAAENTLESSRHPLEAADAASTSERDSVATARVAAEGSSSRSLPPSHFSTDNAFIASESADAREEKATWCVALTAFKLFLSLQLKSSALFRDAVCSFFGAFLSLIALVASTSCLVFLQRPLEGNPKSLLPHNYDAIVGVAVSTLITLEGIRMLCFPRTSAACAETGGGQPEATTSVCSSFVRGEFQISRRAAAAAHESNKRPLPVAAAARRTPQICLRLCRHSRWCFLCFCVTWGGGGLDRDRLFEVENTYSATPERGFLVSLTVRPLVSYSTRKPKERTAEITAREAEKDSDPISHVQRSSKRERQRKRQTDRETKSSWNGKKGLSHEWRDAKEVNSARKMSEHTPRGWCEGSALCWRRGANTHPEVGARFVAAKSKRIPQSSFCLACISCQKTHVGACACRGSGEVTRGPASNASLCARRAVP
ncbi:uncharacterized protein LOC113147073 [Cyclospora cayetanensis]|uniref:Uncharacterized protein LOC113147073 n=1 Tax=Cyclospora cayetanensis TaxID=88456 RepID=A0A6P6RW47_9EIME|nr:uncharacterized protein LOC113147073 [Cyclospora cayetanensis]